MAEAPVPIQALLDFIGMEDVVKDALWDAMGGISKVRELVFIPLEDWDSAVKDLSIVSIASVEAGEGQEEQPAHLRRPKPTEKAQVGMLRRYARLLCGLAGDEVGMGLPGAGARASQDHPRSIPGRPR